VSSQPVGPCDCALAVAIPTRRDQFLADLEEQASKDFAKQLRRQMGRRGEVVWDRWYADFADFVLDVARDVARQGVAVCMDAGLDAVGELTRQHRVVTLFAHWCFPPLLASDVLRPDVVLAGIRAARGIDTSAVDDLAVAALLASDERVEQAGDAQELASALNEALAPSIHYYVGASPGGLGNAASPLSHDKPQAGLTRPLLEEAFPGCFKPARCLELGDGLWSIWDLVNGIKEDFDGVLDLTVCNSLIPGEIIKRYRRRCTAITNRQLASAEVRLVTYRHVIRSLNARAEAFEDVVMRAHLGLLAEIARHKGN
jgi:hypothetical protein